ncbi:MAG TPA: hypothetical protein VFY27_02315 [Woeseiaceae bacterium]|nr:hypothetical protein [Woeseiaceae bacterium]
MHAIAWRLGAEAETRFSWNVVAEGTLKLYESHLTAADGLVILLV